MDESLHLAILQYGWIAVLFLMLSNGFGSFPPSEIVLCLGGVVAAHHPNSFLSLLLAGIAGNVVGAILLFYVSRCIGLDRIYSIRSRLAASQVRFLSFILPEQALVDRFRYRLATGNGRWVCYGRCIPVIRSVISVPAALFGMRVTRFTAYTCVGCTVWASIWMTGGFFIGKSILAYGRWAAYAVAVVVAIVSGVFLYHTYLNYRKQNA